MKHFLSFCGAMCIILLLSFVVSPSYAGVDLKKNTDSEYSLKSTKQISVNHFEMLAVYSPGNLPERIRIPEPSVKKISQPVKDDRDRDKENRVLKTKIFTDSAPPSNI